MARFWGRRGQRRDDGYDREEDPQQTYEPPPTGYGQEPGVYQPAARRAPDGRPDDGSAYQHQHRQPQPQPQPSQPGPGRGDLPRSGEGAREGRRDPVDGWLFDEPSPVRSAPVPPVRERVDRGHAPRPGVPPEPSRHGDGPRPGTTASEPGRRAEPTPPPRGRPVPAWQPRVLGTPIADFEPRPAESTSYRPDAVADGWSTRDFTVRAASVRGYAHRYRGIPRQDDVTVSVHRPSGAVVFAVADGVSAAPQSHIGATVVCRAAVGAIMADLDGGGRIDWQNVVQQSAWQLVEQARVVLGLAEVDRAAAEAAMATTLVAGMVLPDGPTVSLIQVGDSSAWVLRDRSYQCLLDDKFGGAGPVFSSSVTALPRTPRVTPRTGQLGPDEVLLVGTDGFGDPLGDGRGQVGSFFAGHLGAPVPPLTLAYYLDFSRETYDDDRTLLAVWPRTGS
ncbi:protein phosphatase 2C domain-containing protein [Micromonospora carbonacea]|uniref:protein phosphatase 2C domain-containing protein n=1 Tax=Micromonospora carbonacea TaxID=47853 RepID=UPI003710DE55